LSKSISDAGSEVKHAPVSGVKGKLFLIALGQSFIGEGQWRTYQPGQDRKLCLKGRKIAYNAGKLWEVKMATATLL
jgi:hypothetical protein